MAVRNESEYRRLQRHLGEIQVALSLANGVHKAKPGDPELAKAVRSLIQVKQGLFQQILRLESEGVGQDTGSTRFCTYKIGG